MWIPTNTTETTVYLTHNGPNLLIFIFLLPHIQSSSTFLFHLPSCWWSSLSKGSTADGPSVQLPSGKLSVCSPACWWDVSSTHVKFLLCAVVVFHHLVLHQIHSIKMSESWKWVFFTNFIYVLEQTENTSVALMWSHTLRNEIFTVLLGNLTRRSRFSMHPGLGCKQDLIIDHSAAFIGTKWKQI